MKSEEIIQELARVPGVYGVYQIVLKYRIHRKLIDGTHQDVEVEIIDYGTKSERGYGYNCIATSDDGRIALGNGAFSIEDALSIVNWAR